MKRFVVLLVLFSLPHLAQAQEPVPDPDPAPAATPPPSTPAAPPVVVSPPTPPVVSPARPAARSGPAAIPAYVSQDPELKAAWLANKPGVRQMIEDQKKSGNLADQSFRAKIKETPAPAAQAEPAAPPPAEPPAAQPKQAVVRGKKSAEPPRVTAQPPPPPPPGAEDGPPPVVQRPARGTLPEKDADDKYGAQTQAGAPCINCGNPNPPPPMSPGQVGPVQDMMGPLQTQSALPPPPANAGFGGLFGGGGIGQLLLGGLAGGFLGYMLGKNANRGPQPYPGSIYGMNNPYGRPPWWMPPQQVPGGAFGSRLPPVYRAPFAPPNMAYGGGMRPPGYGYQAPGYGYQPPGYAFGGGLGSYPITGSYGVGAPYPTPSYGFPVGGSPIYNAPGYSYGGNNFFTGSPIYNGGSVFGGPPAVRPFPGP